MLLYNRNHIILFHLLFAQQINMLSSFQIKNMFFYSADELKTSFPNFLLVLVKQ